MENNIKVNGLITICMEWAYIHGPIKECTLASTLMTKSMAMEFISGKMEDNTKVIGTKANNMV